MVTRSLQFVFVAFLLISTSAAFACLDFGDSISVEGSSFQSVEQIVYRNRPDSRERTSCTHSIKSDGNFICYNNKLNCWAIDSENGNPAKCVSAHVDMQDSTGTKNLGVVETKGNKLFIFSVDSSGQKDIKNPYLVFIDQTDLDKVKNGVPTSGTLEVQAYVNSKQTGDYKSVNDGYVHKAFEEMPAKPQPQKISVGGKQIDSIGCTKKESSFVADSGNGGKLLVSPAAK